MSPKRTATFVLLGVGFLATALGGFILARKVSHIESWHATEARLLSSRAVPAPGGIGMVPEYELWYTVNGKTYTRTYRSEAGSESSANERVGSRAVGTLYTVFYDPADPNQVNPNLGYNRGTIGLAVMITALGLALMLFAAAVSLAGRSAQRVI